MIDQVMQTVPENGGFDGSAAGGAGKLP
jgi:hypothetical protein